MSAILKCPTCKSDYDKDITIPSVLPCNHTFCQICLLQQLAKNKKQYQCFTCSDIHTINPKDLPQNQEIMDQIEQRTQKQKQLDDLVSNLEKSKKELTQLLISLSHQKSQIQKDIIKLLDATFLQESNTLFGQMKKELSFLNQKQKLTAIISQQYRLGNQDIKSIENHLQISENISDIIKNADYEVKKLSSQKEKIVEQIEQVLRNKTDKYTNAQKLYDEDQMQMQDQTGIKQKDIKIFVRVLNNESIFAVRVNKLGTIEDIKQQISTKKNLPVESLKLIQDEKIENFSQENWKQVVESFRQKELSNNNTLKDLMIWDQSTIQLLVCLRGKKTVYVHSTNKDILTLEVEPYFKV